MHDPLSLPPPPRPRYAGRHRCRLCRAKHYCPRVGLQLIEHVTIWKLAAQWGNMAHMTSLFVEDQLPERLLLSRERNVSTSNTRHADYVRQPPHR